MGKDDSIVDRYFKSDGADASIPDTGAAEVAAPAAVSGPEVRGSLITLPVSMAAMLDIRFKNGNRMAIPYGYITRVLLDPSLELTVKTADLAVKFRGRHLGLIYTAITNHTALAIAEAPHGYDKGGDDPFVSATEVDEG